jgi:hypothetical protein
MCYPFDNSDRRKTSPLLRHNIDISISQIHVSIAS